MINTKQKEIWKTYPEFSFIEASSLGRIRTKDRWVPCGNGKRLVRGQVLKQQLKNSGYMEVSFRVNGKKVFRLVHRIIASSFIPNPNGLPEVNHKDNNRTNNFASNLEWCTKEYNEAYKKNFGTSQAEVSGQPVFAVNPKTGKVLRFESQSEAGRQLGIDSSQISAVVNGKLIQACGYWFTEDESEITEEKIREIKTKMKLYPVIAVNPETSEVFWFESQSEAARHLGASVGNICNVLKGRYTKTHGYWLCYADEKAVETREKFDDKVAHEVEKLIGENYD